MFIEYNILNFKIIGYLQNKVIRNTYVVLILSPVKEMIINNILQSKLIIH